MRLVRQQGRGCGGSLEEAGKAEEQGGGDGGGSMDPGLKAWRKLARPKSKEVVMEEVAWTQG